MMMNNMNDVELVDILSSLVWDVRFVYYAQVEAACSAVVS